MDTVVPCRTVPSAQGAVYQVANQCRHAKAISCRYACTHQHLAACNQNCWLLWLLSSCAGELSWLPTREKGTTTGMHDTCLHWLLCRRITMLQHAIKRPTYIMPVLQFLDQQGKSEVVVTHASTVHTQQAALDEHNNTRVCDCTDKPTGGRDVQRKCYGSVKQN